MGYYEKTLELMKLNDKVNALKAKLYSLDGVNVSCTASRPQRKAVKGDTIGRIVADREELIAKIEALEEQREPYINDVRRALRGCSNYDIASSIEAGRVVCNVIVENYTIEEAGKLSGKNISQIHKNIRNYLKRMKEREESGTLVLRGW